MARDRHYLVAMRRFAPHTLSEPEERMLSERGPAAASAWHTLFGQITSTLEVPFDAGEGDGVEPHTIDRLLAHVRNPDRDLRRRALEALYDGLEPHTDTLAPRLRHARRATAWRWTSCAATPARWSRRTCATSCPAGWSRR